MSSLESNLSASELEQKVSRLVTEFLLAKEKSVQTEIENYISARVPNPRHIVRELEEGIAGGLAKLGKTADSAVISKELTARLPNVLISLGPKVFAILGPAFGAAAGKIADAVKLSAAALQRRVEELAAELFNAVKAQLEILFRTAFEAVVGAVAAVVAKIVTEIILPLVAAIIARVVALLMIAVAAAISIMVRLLVEAGVYLLQKLGLLVKFILEKIILMILKTILLFVLKMMFRLFFLIFGLSTTGFEAGWLEATASL